MPNNTNAHNIQVMLLLATNFYEQKLRDLNPVILVTPAGLSKLNTEVQVIQNQQIRRESNPVWRLPVRVEPDGVSPSKFHVFIDDSKNGS